MEQIHSRLRGHELALVHPFVFEGYAGRCHVTVPVSEREAPCLILTGAFQGPRSMRSIVDRIGRDSVTITVELPGSTGDEVLPARFGFEWLAASLISAMDELRLEMVNIIAPSYATPLAFYLSALYPDRVGRVVLAGATTALEGESAVAAARSVELLEARRMGPFAAVVCERVVNQDPSIHIIRRRQVLGLIRRQLTRLSEIDSARYIENTRRVLRAPDQLADVGPMTGPTLVYTGEHDLLTPPPGGRRLLQRIPRGVFTLIRHTDHLFYLEDPATTVELMARFLDDTLDGSLESITPLERLAEPSVAES